MNNHYCHNLKRIIAIGYRLSNSDCIVPCPKSNPAMFVGFGSLISINMMVVTFYNPGVIVSGHLVSVRDESPFQLIIAPALPLGI
jgi:hypothetical protein